MLWQKEVILVKQHLTICQKIQQRWDDSQILSTSESIPLSLPIQIVNLKQAVNVA